MSRLAATTTSKIAFIGVTTGSSSIRRVFPAWARRLGLDAELVGIDLAPRSEPAAYRAVVEALRDDPLVRGALVTTHKLALYDACRDLFDEIDPYAAAMGEVSCIAKRGGALRASAKDPMTAALALESFLPAEPAARAMPEAFVIGAGGSAIALTWHLMQRRLGNAAPARIVVSDRDPDRLAHIARIHETVETGAELTYVLADRDGANDAALATLRPGSLVVNATGLGKDAPGSPLGDGARFPARALVWDFNYRGDLAFLEQARAQRAASELHVEDGWTYFVHGWLAGIAEVFDLTIPTAGPEFDELARVAASASASDAATAGSSAGIRAL